MKRKLPPLKDPVQGDLFTYLDQVENEFISGAMTKKDLRDALGKILFSVSLRLDRGLITREASDTVFQKVESLLSFAGV